jgi:hypothetical protein
MVGQEGKSFRYVLSGTTLRSNVRFGFNRGYRSPPPESAEPSRADVTLLTERAGFGLRE